MSKIADDTQELVIEDVTFDEAALFRWALPGL